MRRSKRLFLVTTLTLLVMAPAISSASTVKSGVRGSVRRGPTQPVCYPESPCTAPAAGVTLTFVRGAAARSTRTNANGRYSIHLAAGTYTVRVGAAASYGPRSVRVSRGRMSTVNIVLDTGIR
jgi:hypothetical protein